MWQFGAVIVREINVPSLSRLLEFIDNGLLDSASVEDAPLPKRQLTCSGPFICWSLGSSLSGIGTGQARSGPGSAASNNAPTTFETQDMVPS
jgi:hypothetical protein